MTIAVGDKIPSVTVQRKTDDGIDQVSTDEYFAGRKVVLFAVPGAFTPTCSQQHLPGFVANAEAIKAKGVDEIACVAVNDAFVMDAWGKQHNADDQVMMIADGSAHFSKAIGLELDLDARGMGLRSQRYSMLVNDGVVEKLNLEGPGKFEVSDAETMLASLQAG